jgi:hypothetical protein
MAIAPDRALRHAGLSEAVTGFFLFFLFLFLFGFLWPALLHLTGVVKVASESIAAYLPRHIIVDVFVVA